MQAEGGQFRRSDVVPDESRAGGSAHQLLEERGELAFGVGDVVTPVDESGHLRRAVPAPVEGDQGVRGQHRLQPLPRVAGTVAQGSELLEVRGDVPLVPGDQHRFDVREVLVERRPTDAGPRGDLRHGDPERSTLGGQGPGGVQDRVLHGAAVLVDRLAPELRHRQRIRCVRTATQCLDRSA
jgi:hypothetical protein